MKKQGQIKSAVVFSAGDGAEQSIPLGACEIEATSQDVTISWVDGASSGVAAIPVDVYTTYLTEGAIGLE